MTGSYPRRKGIYIMRDKNLLHILLTLIYLGMRPCIRRFLGFGNPVFVIRTFLSFNGGSVHYRVNTPHSLNVWLGRDPAAKLLLINVSAYSLSSPGLRLGRLLRPENEFVDVEYIC